MQRVFALAIFVASFASACGLLPKATPNPGVLCDQVYDSDTCVALIDLATKLLHKDVGEIVSLTILPEPSVPIMSTGAASPIRVRYWLKDGSSHEAALCGGVSMEPVCSAQPRASSS